MRPICVPCQQTMRPDRNGICFVETDQNGAAYALWMGDQWKCQSCGHTAISGVGFKPIAARHQPDFAHLIETCNATLRIKDF